MTRSEQESPRRSPWVIGFVVILLLLRELLPFWLAGINHSQGDRGAALESTALSLLRPSGLFQPVAILLGFFLGSTTDLLTFIARETSATSGN